MKWGAPEMQAVTNQRNKSECVPFVFQDRVLYIKRMEPPLHNGLVGRSPATLEKRVPINQNNANHKQHRFTSNRHPG